MPFPARAKRRAAKNFDSRALKVDSRQTDICACLYAILPVKLEINALFDWRSADAAALIMLPIIIKEGIKAIRGETCADCHG